MVRTSKNTLVKLLAAGCVVGLIGGVAAQDGGADPGAADPVDPGADPEGNPEDMAQVEEPDVEEPEEDAMGDMVEDDAGEEMPEEEEEMPEEEMPEEEMPEEEMPEEEMPDEEMPEEEMPEEEMPEEEMPEEEMPEEEEEMPEEEMMSPPPDVTVLATVGGGYNAQEGVDYIPGEGLLNPVQNVGEGMVVADATECATMCEGDPTCNFASYYTTEWPGGNNCWMKAISPGCGVPSDATADPTAWLIFSTTRCDIAVEVEEEAGAPIAEALPPITGPPGVYTAFPGSDYIPGPGLLTEVMDIEGSSMMVADQASCEALCDATPMCNGASFYIEGSEVIAQSESNCFPKTFGDSCEVPGDALVDPTAVLLLKSCEETDELTAAPPFSVPNTTMPETNTTTGGDETFDMPTTGALGGNETTTETGDDTTDRSTGTGTTTGDVTEAPSGSISMRSAAAAFAVAGVALAVF